jgi:hypothetical protein
LIGIEHTRTETFAQWLWFDEKRMQETVVASLPLAELNSKPGLIVQGVSAERSTTASCAFRIKVSSREAGLHRTIWIELGEPGEITVIRFEDVHHPPGVQRGE